VYSHDLFSLVHIDTDNDPPEELNEWWDQYEHDFPILAGCGELGDDYTTGGIPHTTLLDACGVVIGNWVGWAESIVPQMQAVIEQHLNAPPLVVAEVDLISESDGDGIVEPGENVSIDIMLHDLCIEYISGVSAMLSTELDWITIEQPAATYPEFTPGDIYPGSAFYELLVDAEAPPVFDVVLTLEVTIGEDVWNLPVPFSGGERHVYYTSQVEAAEPDWTIDNAVGWEGQWHISQLDNNSPENSWHCGADSWNDYDAHLDSYLISPALVLLPHSQLQIQHRMNAEVSIVFPDSAYDGGIVEISLNDGDTWNQLMPLDGYNVTFRWESGGGAPASHPFQGGTPCFSGEFDWREDTFDLNLLGEQTVLFRFRFGSDNGGGDTGWFIDDITLLGYDGVEVVNTSPVSLPDAPQLTAAYPNPFNGTTRLEFSLPLDAEATMVIYDLMGRKVAVPFSGFLPAGQHSYSFNADGLATGVYFALLQVDGNYVDQQKLLLVK
jgi:hypothetical protein